MGCAIIGCGKSLPALAVANDDLTQLVDTSDEWITTRTGIKSRRIAVGETNVDMAEGAARQAMGLVEGGYCEAPIEPESIDLVVYSTCTPDVLVPSCAALVRRRLGLVNAVAFDVNAACSGFIYAMSVAESMMATSAAGVAGAGRRNKVRRALVIGSERLTRITNWEDRTTCVLFGDGGGAAVVEWDEGRAGVLATYMKNDDDDTNALTCPSAFDSPQPFDVNGVSKEAAVAGDPGNARIDEELGVTEAVAAGRPRQSLFMHGQTIFKFAASAMGNAIDEVCKRADVDIDDVKLRASSGQRAHHQIRCQALRAFARPLPGFYWRSRKRFFRLRADGAFRRVRIGAHPKGRQGDSRGLRRRAYQRRRALRGVSKPRLSCFAG